MTDKKATLFDRYIERMFKRMGQRDKPYSVEEHVAILNGSEADIEAFADIDEPDAATLQQIENEFGDGAYPNDEILAFASEVLAQEVVRTYLGETDQVNVVTGEDELALAERIESGITARNRLGAESSTLRTGETVELIRQEIEGKLAKRQLAEAYRRIVVAGARDFIGQGLPFLDLVSAGHIGLLRAVETFGGRRGCRFSTYACWWIGQAIHQTLEEQVRPIRVPSTLVSTLNKLVSTQRRLLREYGREPTAKEIVLEMDQLSPEDIQAIKVALVNHRRLEPALERRWCRAVSKIRRLLPIAQEPALPPVGISIILDESSIATPLEEGKLFDPLEVALRPLKEHLPEILGGLSERDRRVLQMRCGLMDGENHTLEEVGNAVGVTHEQILQIEAEALRKVVTVNHSRKS